MNRLPDLSCIHRHWRTVHAKFKEKRKKIGWIILMLCVCLSLRDIVEFTRWSKWADMEYYCMWITPHHPICEERRWAAEHIWCPYVPDRPGCEDLSPNDITRLKRIEPQLYQPNLKLHPLLNDDGRWLIFIAINLFGVWLVWGRIDTLAAFGFWVVGNRILAYVLFLHKTLSEVYIDLLLPYAGDAGLLIFLYILLRHTLTTVKEFLAKLCEMIKKVWKPLSLLAAAYVIIAILFGLAYASIYVWIGDESFDYDAEQTNVQFKKGPQLMDFVLYSLLVPIMLDIPRDISGISPATWPAKTATFFEIIFGIAAFVIYLGVIVNIVAGEYLRR